MFSNWCHFCVYFLLHFMLMCISLMIVQVKEMVYSENLFIDDHIYLDVASWNYLHEPIFCESDPSNQNRSDLVGIWLIFWCLLLYWCWWTKLVGFVNVGPIKQISAGDLKNGWPNVKPILFIGIKLFYGWLHVDCWKRQWWKHGNLKLQWRYPLTFLIKWRSCKMGKVETCRFKVEIDF